MPLRHEKPNPALMAELKEVADAAGDVLSAKPPNYPLPDGFPKLEVNEICKTLIQLPNGEAEGSREQMLTSHKQLSEISGQYILLIRDEDIEQKPGIDRNSGYGKKIDDLIQKLYNAIREYEKQAKLEIFDGFTPSSQVDIPDDDPQVLDVQNASADLDAALDESKMQADRILKPDSENADRFKRQLVSAKGTNRLISISVRLKTEAGEWYTRLVNSLQDYDTLLKNAVNRLERGADIVAGFEDAVDEGITKTIETVFSSLAARQEPL